MICCRNTWGDKTAQRKEYFYIIRSTGFFRVVRIGRRGVSYSYNFGVIAIACKNRQLLIGKLLSLLLPYFIIHPEFLYRNNAHFAAHIGYTVYVLMPELDCVKYCARPCSAIYSVNRSSVTPRVTAISCATKRENRKH